MLSFHRIAGCKWGEPMPADTVIRLENKRIVVKDNGERMKVKVYELTEEGDSIDSEMIFEGHYRDGQSYERRKHIKSINIPIPSWDKDFDPHWAGFGMASPTSPVATGSTT